MTRASCWPRGVVQQRARAVPGGKAPETRPVRRGREERAGSFAKLSPQPERASGAERRARNAGGRRRLSRRQGGQRLGGVVGRAVTAVRPQRARARARRRAGSGFGVHRCLPALTAVLSSCPQIAAPRRRRTERASAGVCWRERRRRRRRNRGRSAPAQPFPTRRSSSWSGASTTSGTCRGPSGPTWPPR